MATNSSVLAWRIPGMAELGGLSSMGSHRVGHDWNNLERERIYPSFPFTDVCACLVVQLHLTLCNPMDCSLPGSSVHGILHARILEWVAMPSFRGLSQPRDQTQVSHIAGGFFTVWATREGTLHWYFILIFLHWYSILISFGLEDKWPMFCFHSILKKPIP